MNSDAIKKFIIQSVHTLGKTFLQFGLLAIAYRFLFTIELISRTIPNNFHLFTILQGLAYDCIFCCKIGLFALLPLALLKQNFPKFSAIATYCLLIVYCLFSFISTEYFCTVGKPLDHVILIYSPQELTNTILWSTNISIASIINVTIHILVTIILFIWSKKIEVTTPQSLIMLCAIILAIFIPLKKWYANEFLCKSHKEFLYVVNQPAYLYTTCFDYLQRKNTVTKGQEMIAAEKYHLLFPENSFYSGNYPFMRKNKNNDVLASFFDTEKLTNKPNLVFIIIESFGQKLSNDNPQFSFTPFIDSLKNNSLYWENCISSTERTFGVLPAIFASVPHGEKGFGYKYIPSFPRHNSLLKDLKRNGYFTSFFYGGNKAFANQDEFLRKNDISYYMSIPDTLLQNNHGNANWGIQDADMFDYARSCKRDTIPFCDIYLTLSTHEPFTIPNAEKYIAKVHEKIQATNTEESQYIREHTDIFSTFLYTDEAVQNLFNYYSKRPDFTNTIFIITGDHRAGYDDFEYNPLRKYHVPLIIYSAQLKRAKKMKGVVSHYDITPSLEHFLQSIGNFSVASSCHWIGTDFDTSTNFHCVKKQAFMHNNRTVTEWIHDTLMVAFNSLFSISDNLNVTEVNNQQKLKQLQEELANFQILSQRAVNRDFLWNDTIPSVK
ncbi:MAG: LTA synthase family protein [Bacteroidales bacterium]|nr:LTA synthase family protein [Bacteroidales bacterium]